MSAPKVTDVVSFGNPVAYMLMYVFNFLVSWQTSELEGSWVSVKSTKTWLFNPCTISKGKCYILPRASVGTATNRLGGSSQLLHDRVYPSCSFEWVSVIRSGLGCSFLWTFADRRVRVLLLIGRNDPFLSLIGRTECCLVSEVNSLCIPLSGRR